MAINYQLLYEYSHYTNFIQQKGVFPDLLATSGDYLRIWKAGEPDTRLECLLNNVTSTFLLDFQNYMLTFFQIQNKNSDFCAPLTSFDWNEVEPNLIGTSSIDTTCTIWGLETGQVFIYYCCFSF